MKTTIIDRLIHKPVTLTLPESFDASTLSPWDLIVYKDDEWKELVGKALCYELKDTKKGKFVYPLKETEAKNFNMYQTQAEDLFEIFKKDFKAAFPESVPLTWRMNLQGNTVYFYFYAETRFDFSALVRTLREKIKKRFFIYQVGARDRVRLHKNLDEWFDASGLPLMYSIFNHPLENVDSDVIWLQHLEWRDPEKLKDRSGKLDHTLNFEKDVYELELKEYPKRWSIIRYDGQKMKCIGCNILTQDIKLRGKSEKSDDFRGEWLTISLSEYKAKSTPIPDAPTRQSQRPARPQRPPSRRPSIARKWPIKKTPTS